MHTDHHSFGGNITVFTFGLRGTPKVRYERSFITVRNVALATRIVLPSDGLWRGVSSGHQL